jgi:tetratricopeptide (TPR) repeat protein
MKFFVFCCCLAIFHSVLFSFPYYVDPSILDEVNRNEVLYERFPTNNKIQFDLAMSYAYSGQILNGWTTLKSLPKSYSAEVVDEYSFKMDQDSTQWRYPFKAAFGYFFIGEKLKSIELFQNVLEIDSNQYWAYGFIALVYGEMGDAKKSILYCKKGLAIEPNATGIHFLLAEAYRKDKKYYKAFKHFLKVGRLQAKD